MRGALHCAGSGCDGCPDCAPICSVCDEEYALDDGKEPDGFCHQCAHDLAHRFKLCDLALTVEHRMKKVYETALKRIRYMKDVKRARAAASEALATPKSLTHSRQQTPEGK